MHHPSIKRYSLIIEILSNRKYPSFKDIKEHLYSMGFEVSERTIQRDIERVRDDYGLEITFNQDKKGYFIDKDKSVNLETFFKFLEIVNTAEVLTESLKDAKDVLKHISFDGEGIVQGLGYIKNLLFAIRKKRKINFIYERFQTGIKKNHVLNPYLIKEYQNRWYVIGKPNEKCDFKTFALDRIKELKVSFEKFKPKQDENPKELFDHVVGLSYSNNKHEEVVLSFTPSQAEYEKTLPIHKSAELIKKNKNEVWFNYYLIPNYELEQKILYHGETVKVIKPKWLAKIIKNRLKIAQKNYK